MSESNEMYMPEMEKFSTADLCKRGQYWYVDVLYIDGSKETNFKFKDRLDAESFLNYVFELNAERKDKTNYNGYHLFLFFGIGVLSGVLLNMML